MCFICAVLLNCWYNNIIVHSPITLTITLVLLLDWIRVSNQLKKQDSKSSKTNMHWMHAPIISLMK